MMEAQAIANIFHDDKHDYSAFFKYIATNNLSMQEEIQEDLTNLQELLESQSNEIHDRVVALRDNTTSAIAEWNEKVYSLIDGISMDFYEDLPFFTNQSIVDYDLMSIRYKISENIQVREEVEQLEMELFELIPTVKESKTYEEEMKSIVDDIKDNQIEYEKWIVDFQTRKQDAFYTFDLEQSAIITDDIKIDTLLLQQAKDIIEQTYYIESAGIKSLIEYFQDYADNQYTYSRARINTELDALENREAMIDEYYDHINELELEDQEKYKSLNEKFILKDLVLKEKNITYALHQDIDVIESTTDVYLRKIVNDMTVDESNYREAKEYVDNSDLVDTLYQIYMHDSEFSSIIANSISDYIEIDSSYKSYKDEQSNLHQQFDSRAVDLVDEIFMLIDHAEQTLEESDENDKIDADSDGLYD